MISDNQQGIDRYFSSAHSSAAAEAKEPKVMDHDGIHRGGVMPVNQRFKTLCRRAMEPDNIHTELFGFEQSCLVNECSYQVFALMDQAEILAWRDKIAGVYADDDDKRFNIGYCTLSKNYANRSNCNVNFRVYFCTVRIQNPVATPFDSIVQTGFQDRVGADQVTNVTVAGNLFMNPQFCAFAHIDHVKEYTIEPGKEATFSMSCAPFTPSDYLLNSAVWETYAGYTRLMIVQMWGAKTQDLNVAQRVGTAPVTCEITVTRVRRGTVNPLDPDNVWYTDNRVTPADPQVVVQDLYRFGAPGKLSTAAPS